MTQFLRRGGKPDLAYIYTPASGDGENLPLLMFCGGYRSDMTGTKAQFLESKCRERGQAYLRFDYSGHGQSGGAFEDGTISIWRDDALAVLDHVNPDRKPVMLIGSSMGGWLMLLVGLALGERLSGMVGIAAAPDFSKNFDVPHITPAQQASLEEKGYYELPNDYSDEPYIVTKALLEDGAKNFLLGKKHSLPFPIHLLQGRQDASVPEQTALDIQAAFGSENVGITFIDDGDHSLSRPQDLEILDTCVKNFISGGSL